MCKRARVNAQADMKRRELFLKKESSHRCISRMERVIIKQDFRASPRAFLAWNGWKSYSSEDSSRVRNGTLYTSP